MRELRVEDALVYLDQVKMEFGDRPHIYNEFLDIMKTFKTQLIDTPGVIRRVSTLFQGNKKLVLGFNTFLPEGYKIELPDDGDGPPVAVYKAPGQTQVTQILGPAAPPPPSAPASTAHAPQMGQPPAGQPGVGSRPGFPPIHAAQPPHRAHPAQGAPQQPLAHAQQQHPTAFRTQNPAGQPPAPGQHAGMVVDSAYAQQQQSQLAAHGPPQQQNLGMQRQQPPPGPQSIMERRLSQEQRPGLAHAPPPRPPHETNRLGGPPQIQTGPPAAAVPPPHAMAHAPPPHAVHAQPPPPQHHQAPSHPPHAQDQQARQQQQQQQPQQQQPGQPQQGQGQGTGQQAPVEFDHAINYVTTIKRRFANAPNTYKKFLEILHTYQKEQRGIKEVLDEVSVLFADHPDLLKEFTYFLPDAVQAQAKAQLDQVAKESEARKRLQSSKQAIMQQAQGMQQQTQAFAQQRNQQRNNNAATAATQSPVANQGPTRVAIPFGASQGRTEEREREIARSAMYGLVSFTATRPPRRKELSATQSATKKGRPQMIPELPAQPTTAESAFFQRAKLHLNRRELAPDKPQGTRRNTPYLEFLKCLHLFASGVLNKEELVLLLRGLFMQGHAPKSGAHAGGGASNPAVANDAQELLREFEEVLVGRGHLADQEHNNKDKSKYGGTSVRELDFSHCERPTPSYRSYPTDYPCDHFTSHSGQTALDASVLNETLVCVPDRRRMCWSPEEYDGPSERQNIYEEALFRVEDERHEVDMAIERNVMAMRQVEPIAEEVRRLRATEEKDGQPIGRMNYKLRSRQLNGSQINAIARLYGESGDEVLQHLVRNPVAVLPIVFSRLRQKDNEWREVKAELAKKWNVVNESNFEGSLDATCWSQRKDLERLFDEKRMVKEIKNIRNFLRDPSPLSEKPATRFFYPHITPGIDDERLLFQPHSRFPLRNNVSHKDVYKLVAQSLSRKPESEKEAISRIWAEFVARLFRFPPHWIRNELREFKRESKQSSIVRYAVGQRVMTTFGEGQILSVIEGTQGAGFRYRIKLAFGLGYIRPESIVHLVRGGRVSYVRNGPRMERCHSKGDESATCLRSNCTLVFGSQSTYCFIRLYCYLANVLSAIEEHFGVIEDLMDIQPSIKPRTGLMAKKEKVTETHDFASYLKKAQNFLSSPGAKDVDFEKYCRACLGRASSNGRQNFVALLSVVPSLAEKCGEALSRVAREDALLTLYDYSKLTDYTDIVWLREQSQKVIDKPCYRIQYDESTSTFYFAYVEADLNLLAPPEEAGEEEDHTMVEYADDHADEQEEGEPYEEEGERGESGTGEQDGPEPKRIKLA